MKTICKRSFVLLMAIMLLLPTALPVQAADNVIDEKLGAPIIVYGGNLTDEQLNKTKELLDVDDGGNAKTYKVTGEDIARYIDGNPDARMFSSAKIAREEKGDGLSIQIVTQDNITEVSSEMYANALLTAGVENATVHVASPVKVTGHSALTGIYKAYDAEGEELNKERMELANEELGVATDLAEDNDLSQEEVSNLLTEIKQKISDMDPVSREEVKQIVDDKLNDLNISLNESDKQMLIDLFEKMRNLDIDFGQVKDQLQGIADTVKNKMDELGLDEGFWQKVGNFFKNLFDSIAGLFK